MDGGLGLRVERVGYGSARGKRKEGKEVTEGRILYLDRGMHCTDLCYEYKVGKPRSR